MVACDILYHPAGFGHAQSLACVQCPLPDGRWRSSCPSHPTYVPNRLCRRSGGAQRCSRAARRPEDWNR